MTNSKLTRFAALSDKLIQTIQGDPFLSQSQVNTLVQTVWELNAQVQAGHVKGVAMKLAMVQNSYQQWRKIALEAS